MAYCLPDFKKTAAGLSWQTVYHVLAHNLGSTTIKLLVISHVRSTNNYAGARLCTRVGWVTAKTTGFTEQYMELNKGTTK